MTAHPVSPGQRFGRWTVLERARAKPGDRHVMWLCRCACGVERPVRPRDLRTGRTKGCIACHTRKDLKGEVFGAWTVLDISHVSPGRKLYWLCRCTCGDEHPVEGSSLRLGRSTRCGSCRSRAQHALRKARKTA